MKTPIRFLVLLIGLSMFASDAEARGFGGGGGGRKVQRAAPKRQMSRPQPSRQVSRPKPQRQVSRPKVNRNSFTGSKVQRPSVQRPKARPATQIQRPKAKPAVQRPTPKPAVQRPQVQRPTPKPAIQRPSVQRPSVQRPQARPDNNRPNLNRPGGNNNQRPGIANRPDKRPASFNPNKQHPSTLPGMVSYPNRAGKPGIANRPGNNDRGGIGNRDGIGNNNRGGIGNNNRGGIGNNSNNRGGIGNNNRITNRRPTVINRPKVDIGQVNVGGRNVGISRPSTLPANRRNWNNNRWGGNNSIWGNRVNIGNNVNVNVNNRFLNNNNYAYRPGYWGAHPWWGAGYNHSWHHGHWNYGWSAGYYNRNWYFHDDHDFAQGFMWGITAWSFGKMIYDMGYKTYSNPYPAPPVENTYVTYSQPVAVAAAENPPGDEDEVKIAEEKSNDAFEDSKASFASGDYTEALGKINEALGYTPDDVSLHEYRALVLFALGKYGDAAGVLNPVLASGPGWGWDTMIGFYGSSSTYDDQLNKLEDYVKGSPDAADAHFLLGYHYLVCGHMPEANQQFDDAARLQPADSISAQLRDLTADSVQTDDEESETPPEPTIPDPVPADQLPGTWTSNNGDAGTVTLTLKEGGDFTWDFQPKEGDASEFTGSYGIDDQGLLVLTTDDAQMMSEIELQDDGELHFALIGAPDNDPGLSFTKG